MVKIICSECGKKLEAPDEAAGNKGRCPGCGAVFKVPDIKKRGRKCPAHGIVYPAKALFCASCGINIRSGAKVPAVFKIYCNGCKKKFEVPGEKTGIFEKCPECGKFSVIPDGSALPCPDCGTANVERKSPGEGLLLCIGMVISAVFILWSTEALPGTGGDIFSFVVPLILLFSVAATPFAFIGWIVRRSRQCEVYLCKACPKEFYIIDGEYTALSAIGQKST